MLAGPFEFDLSDPLSQLLLQPLHRVFLRRADCRRSVASSQHGLESFECRQPLRHEVGFLELGILQLAAQCVEARGVVGQKILHLLSLQPNLRQTVRLRCELLALGTELRELLRVAADGAHLGVRFLLELLTLRIMRARQSGKLALGGAQLIGDGQHGTMSGFQIAQLLHKSATAQTVSDSKRVAQSEQEVCARPHMPSSPCVVPLTV